MGLEDALTGAQRWVSGDMGRGHSCGLKLGRPKKEKNAWTDIGEAATEATETAGPEGGDLVAGILSLHKHRECGDGFSACLVNYPETWWGFFYWFM